MKFFLRGDGVEGTYLISEHNPEAVEYLRVVRFASRGVGREGHLWARNANDLQVVYMTYTRKD